MQTIWNRTARPLRIALHGGHILHLGPHRTGQIADHDVERPSFRQLVVKGEIAVLEATEGGEGPHMTEAEANNQRRFSPYQVLRSNGGRTGSGRRVQAA